jgi:hypothetical protein
MARFTNAEYANMHFLYGSCDRNAKTAMKEYKYPYPDPKHTNRHVFATVHCSLRETGAFMPLAHIGHEDAISRIKWEYWLLHMLIHLPALMRPQQASLRVQFGMHCIMGSCIFFMYNFHTSYSQDTISQFHL